MTTTTTPTGLELLAMAYAAKKRKVGHSPAVDLFAPSASTFTGGGGLFDRPAPPQSPRVSDLLAGTAVDEGTLEVPDIDLENPSAFESTLKTLGLGGYGIRNILKGNIEGTARNLVDAISSPLRALLPGDQSHWELSRHEDLPEFSDVVGGMAPGIGKTAVDIIGGIASDPLSFLGVGVAGGIGKGAVQTAKAAAGGSKALGVGLPFLKPVMEIPGSAKGLELLAKTAKGITPPLVADAAKGAGHAMRKTFAALSPTAKVASDVAASEGLGSATRQAAQTYPVASFAGVSPVAQRRAVELLRGVSSEMGPGYTDLGMESAKEFLTKAEQMDLIDQRLAGMTWNMADKQSVRNTAELIVDYTRGQFSQGVGDKVFSIPDNINATSSLATRLLEQAPADYFPGRYADPLAAIGGEARTALPKMTKAAKWKTSGDLATGLSQTGNMLETDIGKILGEYGEQMGGAAKSADIASRTVGPTFRALTDEPSRAAMTAAIDGLRAAGDLDSAHVLEATFKGLPPPWPIMRTLARINQPFKAAATAGVLIPNLNFTIGNTVSNVVQAVQNPEARGVAMKSLMALPRIIAGSIGDGLKRVGITAFPDSHFDEVMKAAKASGGTRESMLRLIKDPDLKAAVEHGVLDGGFVSAEELGTQFATKGDPKNWRNLAYWTQDIARASEQRMRYGMFKDLKESGKSYADAARIVDDTLFNYKYSSVANRNARQVIPFGQYTFKATPQVAKFLAEKPAAAIGLNALYSQNNANENPLPPWVQGNINLPLGKGETGNPQYLTSLRLPFEQLAKLPNPSGDLGDIVADTQHDIVGQFSPLIKTGIAVAGGNDPFSGQPFMSNDRVPAALELLGMEKGSNTARRYNALVATGAIQPLAAPINNLSKLLDKRQSAPVAALNALTGLKIIDVDEQQALRQIIEDAIRRNPSIRSSANYYELNKTPEGQALLKRLREVQKALKANRQAAS